MLSFFCNLLNYPSAIILINTIEIIMVRKVLRERGVGGRGGEDVIGQVEAHYVLFRRGGWRGRVEESCSVLFRVSCNWSADGPAGSGGRRGRGGGEREHRAIYHW